MNINTVNTDISMKRLAFEEAAEQQIESDITLPDYFPDIVRVIKCTLKANVVSVSSGGNRITADGNAIISVLYICESGKLHCFEQKIPVSKYVETPKAEEYTCVVSAKTQYVNCRVISQRRIDIRGSIGIDFKAYEKCDKRIVSSCENKNIQLRTKAANVSNLKDCVSRCFSMNETIEIGASQGTIGQIVRCNAIAVLDSTKLVSGKILVKGELKVKVVFLTDGECVLGKIENSMPISQIIEAATTESCSDFVTLCVPSVEVHAKTDSSGALRLIDVSAVIRADVSIYENEEIQYTTDAYSTEYETDFQRESVELKSIFEKFSDTYLCKGSVEISGSAVKSIEDIFCNGLNYTVSLSGNEMLISGKANVSFLAVNSEDELQSFDRELDFQYKRATTLGESFSASCNVTPTGIDYILSAENKLDIRIETEINGLIFDASKKQIISDISCDEAKKKKKRSAALTIYFAQQGEEIWEIARRYNTRVDLICAENNINSDCVEQNQKLYIPSV